MELIPLALKIVGGLVGSVGNSGAIPSIIGMLAGDKAEEVAGKIISGAQATFGTTDPKQIELAIQQDKSKADLILARMNADLDAYRIQVDDTKSARERDTQVRAITGTNVRANVMLIGAFLCLVTVLMGVLFYRASIPDGIAAILNTACGSLLTLLGQAFNFEFGSSRGSSEKTDQLTSMLSKAVGK